MGEFVKILFFECGHRQEIETDFIGLGNTIICKMCKPYEHDPSIIRRKHAH